ncbi:hypothetical protein FOZ62_009155 [Perkinsus olseni]|uniref:Uncharacterized protein n=1 Tax=Perkinsus olseni TaxID=32597 RepID=A0A7J6QFV6_PEROL|nr:hypothetical protein FOZ62_009155 [Perkinsus olseni]
MPIHPDSIDMQPLTLKVVASDCVDDTPVSSSDSCGFASPSVGLSPACGEDEVCSSTDEDFHSPRLPSYSHFKRKPRPNVGSGFRPRRIILVRHGESMGNIDEHTYSQIPDWKVPLTGRGRLEARVAGEQIKKLVKRAVFYVSPYRRTVETYEEIAKTIGLDKVVSVRSEPRIREQDFGNFQCPTEMLKCKQERERFGRFFYRFPHGESGADVYDRVTTFLESMKRHWSEPTRGSSRAYRPRTRSDVFAGHLRYTEDSDVVIVTHGVTLRIFLMRWFNWTVDLFEETYNPHNCDVVADYLYLLYIYIIYMLVMSCSSGHGMVAESSRHEMITECSVSGSGQLCSYNPARIGSWECFPDSDAGEDSPEEENSRATNV